MSATLINNEMLTNQVFFSFYPSLMTRTLYFVNRNPIASLPLTLLKFWLLFMLVHNKDSGFSFRILIPTFCHKVL